MVKYHYYVRYGGRTHYHGLHDLRHLIKYCNNVLDPFDNYNYFGFLKRKEIYTDATKWGIYEIEEGGTITLDTPLLSYKELIDRSEGVYFDEGLCRTLDDREQRIKERIRDGYPLRADDVHGRVRDFELKLCARYNRRRNFRRCTEFCICRNGRLPISERQWVIWYNGRFLICDNDNRASTLRGVYILFLLDTYPPHLYSEPFNFFYERFDNRFLLDGLYDGLSAALRAL